MRLMVGDLELPFVAMMGCEPALGGLGGGLTAGTYGGSKVVIMGIKK